jgi:transposase InsO family protein
MRMAWVAWGKSRPATTVVACRRRSSARPWPRSRVWSATGHLQAELIDRQAWRRRDDLEFAVVEWVSWYNTHRLHSSIGNIPPAEFEANYHAATAQLHAAQATQQGL